MLIAIKEKRRSGSMKQIPICNEINDVNLWNGIADSHDTFPYMLCELCDDSISSMVANQTEQREIIITLRENAAENGQGDIFVCVEDTGAYTPLIVHLGWSQISVI